MPDARASASTLALNIIITIHLELPFQKFKISFIGIQLVLLDFIYICIFNRFQE